MILISVTLVTNPILVTVSLNERVGAVVTGIRDTIFNNTANIVKDIVI